MKICFSVMMFGYITKFSKIFFWYRITKFDLTFQILCTMKNKIISSWHIFMTYILHIWKWYRVLFNRTIPYFEIKLNIKNRILQSNRLLFFWRVTMYLINVYFSISRFFYCFVTLKSLLLNCYSTKKVFKWICIFKKG